MDYTWWVENAAGIKTIVVKNATSAPTPRDSALIHIRIPSTDPLFDGWTREVDGDILIITGPARSTWPGAEGVQNVISGGTQHGPVIQGGNISGLVFSGNNAPEVQSPAPVVAIIAPEGITFVNNP